MVRAIRERSRSGVCWYMPEFRPRLIASAGGPSTRMSNAPLFPVASPIPAKSLDENVADLGAVCHVVSVAQGAKSGWTYALVHATPVGVARIATELGLEVYPSRRGNEYFSVCVAKAAQVVSPPAGRLSVVPPAPASGPVVGAPAPAPLALEPGVIRLEIRGTTYVVRETRVKRTNIDVRRFEVRKDAGDVITEPYVVSFQDEAGKSGACSCKDWIYRRHMKGDCKHIHGVRAALIKPRQATIPLRFAN
jgi:hypothetical protein